MLTPPPTPLPVHPRVREHARGEGVAAAARVPPPTRRPSPHATSTKAVAHLGARGPWRTAHGAHGAQRTGG